jgi:hypothetical protein
MEVSGQLHAPAALPPGKSPRRLCDRSLGGPQNRFDEIVRRKMLPLLRLQLRFLGYPVRSQSLYQLRYPGSNVNGSASKYLFLIVYFWIFIAYISIVIQWESASNW